ncbi:MAG TPA: hypothetical protein VFO49_11180 [Nocardioides sp.]|nr:hypothetical protein [Nocardioides sp.]
MNGYDENRSQSETPYQAAYQDPHGQEQPGGRTALFVSIGAAGLAARPAW